MKKILIIGAGKHGRVVAEAAVACGFEQYDFVDDNNEEAIGKTDSLDELAGRYDGVIVSIGDCKLRKAFINHLLEIEAPLVSLIHPASFVSPSAVIGTGSIVLPGAVIHTNASVGIGCIISIGALIDHDAVVEDFSHINTGAIVSAEMSISGKLNANVSI